MTSPLHIALVHYPILDRLGETVATAVTNLDVHDIVRLAATYGCTYHLVTPVQSQQEMVQSIMAHWLTGRGKERVPTRSKAFESLRVAESVSAVCETLNNPRVIGTAARVLDRPTVGYDAAIAEDRDTLVLFGTGHGLHDDVIQQCDALLPPIRPNGYNHLSVRAAVAITLDRLCGDC